MYCSTSMFDCLSHVKFLSQILQLFLQTHVFSLFFSQNEIWKKGTKCPPISNLYISTYQQLITIILIGL